MSGGEVCSELNTVLPDVTTDILCGGSVESAVRILEESGCAVEVSCSCPLGPSSHKKNC